jgi:hypothetical protein
LSKIPEINILTLLSYLHLLAGLIIIFANEIIIFSFYEHLKKMLRVMY